MITEKQHLFIASLFTLVIAAGYFIIVMLKLNTFAYGSGDIAVAEQALWNTLHGRWFLQTFLPVHNNFREHLNFIQFFFLPFYWLAPHTLTLYAVIHLSYGGATLFFFRFLLRRFGVTTAYCLLFAFLLNPSVVFQNIGIMHVGTLATPLLLVTLIFYREQHFRWWLIFLLATTFTSEFIAPTIIMFSLLGLLHHRSWKWIIPPFAVGMSMMIAGALYITVGYSGKEEILKTLTSFFDNTAQLKKRLNVLQLFFRPFAYITPLWSWYLVLLIPSLLLTLVIVHVNRLSIGSHVLAPMSVILLFAVVDVLQKSSQRNRRIILAFVVFATMIASMSLRKELTIPRRSNHSQIVQMLSLIVDDGSVTASRSLSYALSRRHYFYLIDNKQMTDYIAINMDDYEYHDARYQSYLTAVATNGMYVEVFRKKNIVLYIKKS